MKCEDCRYWEHSPTKDNEHVGVCKKRAPSKYEYGTHWSQFPNMGRLQWCGEFKEKEAKCSTS
jgi:hypothetical protein